MWSVSVRSARRDQLIPVGRPQLVAFGSRHAARDVAAIRVGGRLVGDDVGHDAALEQRVEHVGDVGDEPDGDRLAPLAGAEHELERAREVVAAVLQVALAQAPLDPVGIDLGDQDGRAGEHAGQRLRAAHAAADLRSPRAAPSAIRRSASARQP